MPQIEVKPESAIEPSENVQLDTPLKRFLTILFEPHFKFIILISACLSSVCCLNDFAVYVQSEDEIADDLELLLSLTGESQHN